MCIKTSGGDLCIIKGCDYWLILSGLIGQVRREVAFSLYLNLMGVPLLRSFYKL
jgi:hypothetical protein